MISTQILRRYPFFADFSHDQLAAIAKTGEEISTENGYYFFHEGDKIHNIYLVLEGEIAIFIEVPDHTVEQTLTMQLTRNLITEDITVSTLGPGKVFGWSGIIPPHETTAGAKSIKPSLVVKFDCEELDAFFEKDSRFAYLLALNAAKIIRERLRDRHIESLAENILQTA